MIYLTATALVNSLGQGKNATWQAIKNKTSGLQPNNFLDAKLDTWIGRVADLESVVIDGDLTAFNCRNNQLALDSIEVPPTCHAFGWHSGQGSAQCVQPY